MAKVQSTKDDLIAKSIEVFSKNGYYHTSFSDLATACGIEKSHFYYYFKDKRDLMNQCLLSYTKQIQKNVFDISADDAIEPSKRIKKMLNYILKLYTENDYGCLFGNTLVETVGKEPYFEMTIRNFFDKWKVALTSLYPQNSSKEDLEDMVLNDIEKLQGSIMLMRLYKDKSLLKRSIDQIAAKF